METKTVGYGASHPWWSIARRSLPVDVRHHRGSSIQPDAKNLEKSGRREGLAKKKLASLAYQRKKTAIAATTIFFFQICAMVFHTIVGIA